MKHTPGPWIVEESNNLLWIGTPKNNYTKLDEIVCHINQDVDYKISVKEKNRSNAKLMAAAPELLEAVKIGLNNSKELYSKLLDELQSFDANSNEFRMVQSNLEDVSKDIKNIESIIKKATNNQQ